MCEVIVPLRVEGMFHYRVPDHLRGLIAAGHRVLVPFGRRNVTAFVVRTGDLEDSAVDPSKIREVTERLDVEPLVPSDILALATFTSRYYLAPPGEVLKAALPPGLTAASVIRYSTTLEGRRRLEALLTRADERALSPAERRALTKASTSAGLRQGASSAKLVRRLEAEGLLRKEIKLRAKDVEKERLVLSLQPTSSAEEAFDAVGPSLRRRLVVEALLKGPTRAEGLLSVTERRSARDAIRRLDAAGLLARRRETTPDPLTPVPIPIPTATPSPGTAVVPNDIPSSLGSVGASPPILTPEQESACNVIERALDVGASRAFLLHGVTGSGKTEVYLRVIEKARARGRGAIVLVPEIALTPQLEERFRARFGDDVEVLHSAMSPKTRRERWHRLRQARAHIALGARSAVWAPVANLGVVVVDEEHDPSFKQSADVRYNGRDLALVRAHDTGSVAILGSATPSLESMHLVESQRLEELRLSTRVGNRQMPSVEIVDLAEEQRFGGGPTVLSRRLIDRLRATFDAKRQAILFLNRRGFNTIVFCEECKDARKCPHCDVSLTHHKAIGRLRCHHCHHEEAVDSRCPSCGGLAMTPFGAGTERVAEAVLAHVPGAKVLRLDRDITDRSGGLHRTLHAFRAGEADILVGTQMVAKGHDFPRVTLVGVVLADASLALPDFRAAERTFQLLTQVAGRAGRAEDPGHVVIQTFEPRHYAVTSAVAHDTRRFVAIENEARRRLLYPPFTRMGLIRIESRRQDKAICTARDLAELARRHRDPEGRVLGAAPAPIAKIKDRHRFQILLFAPTPGRLVASLTRVRTQMKPPAAGVDVLFDVDPLDLL